MLSIIDTRGRIQHFFKSCFAIVTIACCSASLTRMHGHPVPQKIKQSYTKELQYTGIQHQPGETIFFPMRFCAKLLDDGLFDTHR
jgi:hypothetical protein